MNFEMLENRRLIYNRDTPIEMELNTRYRLTSVTAVETLSSAYLPTYLLAAKQMLISRL
jgi:hypothetical protein